MLRCEDPSRRGFAFSCQWPPDSRKHCDWQGIRAQVSSPGKRPIGASQRRPRAARWVESLPASDRVIGMRLWEGAHRELVPSARGRWHSPPPKILREIKVKHMHTHILPSLPTLQSPSPRSSTSGEEFIQRPPLYLPVRRRPVGLAVLSPSGCSEVERRWRGRRAALTDYPSCPQEGTRVSISATSVWPRICRNSDRERKRAGPGVCV